MISPVRYTLFNQEPHGAVMAGMARFLPDMGDDIKKIGGDLWYIRDNLMDRYITPDEYRQRTGKEKP